MKTVKREPAMIGALVIGVISALMALLVAFGVDLSVTQQEAIIGVAGAAISLLSAVGVGAWIRSMVYAPVDENGETVVAMPASQYAEMAKKARVDRVD